MAHELIMNDPQAAAALEAVAAACHIARSAQRDLERVRQITKDDKSPVTVADFAVQAAVAMSLIQKLGQAAIVGEEHAATLRLSEQAEVAQAVLMAVRSARPGASLDEVFDAIDHCDHDGSSAAYWTLDPIDGTKGFLRGQQYAIALAKVERGRVVLGVMGCPNLPIDHDAPLDQADANGSIYVAMQGQGAWEFASAGANPRQIRSSQTKAGQPIRTCESVEAAHSKHDEAAAVRRELGRAAVGNGGLASTPGSESRGTNVAVRLDSQCKYALVARGQADLYLRIPTKKSYVEKVWDHAAGTIIAQEAGAIVTDIAGAPLDFTHGRRLEQNRGIVCAAAGIHDRVIRAIETLGIGAAV